MSHTLSISKTILALLGLALGAAAWAGPQCNVPKEKWMDAQAFQANLTKQGYHIKQFKVSSGACYEIYGTDKTGKKVEIYFDPASGEVVKAR